MRPYPLLTVLAYMPLLPTIAVGGTLDQFNYQHPNQQVFSDFAIDSNTGRQQTFTVGVGGFLSSIELFIYRLNTSFGTAHFSLRSVDPLGVPLADESIVEFAFDIESVLTLSPSPNIPIIPTLFDLSNYNIRVKPGEVYSVGLERSGGGWLLWSTGNPSRAGLAEYAGGTIYERRFKTGNWVESFPADPIDMEFATYVLPVPEPGAMLLALLCGAAGCARRCHLNE